MAALTDEYKPTRNLRAEAEVIVAGLGYTAPGTLIKVAESSHNGNWRTSRHWAGWVVHVREPGRKRGRAVVTLIHLCGTRFE